MQARCYAPVTRAGNMVTLAMRWSSFCHVIVLSSHCRVIARLFSLFVEVEAHSFSSCEHFTSANLERLQTARVST